MLSYGDIPDRANDYSPSSLLMPHGAIIDGNLKEVHDVDLRDPNQIQEFVPHSWYAYDDEKKGLHPWDGVTQPNFKLGPNLKGTRTNIQEIDESAKYSWIKAPRWKGHAMEVGPLARYVIGYAKGDKEITEQLTFVLKTLDVPVDRAVLDAWPHRRARARMPVGGAQDVLLHGQAHRQREGGRHRDRECGSLGPEDLAERGQGRRLHRSAARRACALDQDQGH